MKKRTREIASPDITPLIDVVFLLLIFFMVSTVFKKDELALLLNLPKTSEGETTQKRKEHYIVELTKDEVALNGKKAKLQDIESLLKSIKNKTLPIELRIDKSVEYERVIKLLDKLKKNQLHNISLITDS